MDERQAALHAGIAAEALAAWPRWLRLLADHAEDAGDAEAAAGYRWLAGRGRRPARRSFPDGKPDVWYWQFESGWDFAEECCLPEAAWETPGHGDWPDFAATLLWGARQIGRWLAVDGGA